MRDLLASGVEAMRACCLLVVVGLLVATAAALRAPAASPGRRAAIFSAGSAVTSCLLSRPAFAGGAAAPSAARTPPAPHARALPTDAEADREIAALTKKIAADEASLVEDRKVILRHTRSTSPAPPRSCLARLCGPTLAAALHESAHAHAAPRARQAKRELQLEIRQLRSFQKTEEAELKREEKIEKGLEKSGRARSPSP